MQRYVAFLSGLPVGRNKISMDTLASLLRKLGFLNVQTHLTTGNVMFDTAPVGVIHPLEAQISRHLKRSINGDIWTFIRTPEELAAIATAAPKPEYESSVYVVLLSDPLDSRTERKLRIRRNDVDTLEPRGREIYWIRRKTGQSAKPVEIRELLDAPATVRTLSTIKRLAGSAATVSGRSRQ